VKPETTTGRVVPMRLQRFLARAGVASRRGSEALMSAGRVRVNGSVAREMGAKVDPAVDVVEVDGRVVSMAQERAYLVFNKPRSVVTTMSDPEGRVTVAQYMPLDEHPGLFPVGRLDFDTTGLLLFTTDGELAHRLLHPRRKVPKTYRALVERKPGPEALRALRGGLELDDGPTAPAQVRTVEHIGPRTVMEITITEGRKRQVRRMFSAVGHPVIELQRVSFGPVALEGLEEGRWRPLTGEEVASLRAAVEFEEEH
jgi:23S rRNA pseudouridine2605 synthase